MNLGVYPVRPWAEFYLTDSGYLSEKYHAGHGKWHRGEDVNRKTGGDTDFGYPVQSMFSGEVIYAETPSESSWGGLVLIRTEEWIKQRIASTLDTPLEVLDILYAHLHQITIKKGTVVNAGDHIGSIGKGGYNQYIAHLHLETRKKSLPAYQPQGKDEKAREEVIEYTLDPKLILSLPLGDFSTIVPTDKREIKNGRLFVNDLYIGSGLVAVNAVDDKVYVKVK